MAIKVRKDEFMVTMSELRDLLEIKTCVGITDEIEKVWACKRIDWDVNHLIQYLDMLDNFKNKRQY